MIFILNGIAPLLLFKKLLSLKCLKVLIFKVANTFLPGELQSHNDNKKIITDFYSGTKKNL